ARPRPGALAGDRSVAEGAADMTMPRLDRAGASSGVGAAVLRRRGGQKRGSSPARFSQRSSILRMKVPPSPPEVVGPVPPPPPPPSAVPLPGAELPDPVTA